jgi:hypothetical protein
MLLAQNLDAIQSGGIPGFTIPNGGLASSGVGTLITLLIPYIFEAAALLLLIYFLLGGLQLMTSRGDPKGIQAAQGKIVNALIGFAIILLAGFVVLLLGRLLRINVFTGLIV